MKNRKDRKLRDDRHRRHVELIRKTWRHAPALPAPPRPATNEAVRPATTDPLATAFESLSRSAREARERAALLDRFEAALNAPATPAQQPEGR